MLELARVRLLILWRLPEAMFWTFVFPVLLTVVLGLAFRERGTEPSPVAVVDGPLALHVMSALVLDEGLRADLIEDAGEAGRLLRSGAVDLLIETDGLEPGLVYDANRPEAALARLRAADALQRGAGRADPLALEERTVTEKGSRYVDWFVPGMLGFGIMSTSLWTVAFAFVETRQKRLLKRLLATPMGRVEFLLSPVVTRLVLLVPETVLLLVFATLVLDMPLVGSVLELTVLIVLGALSFSGFGILMGSRARTPEAASGIMNLAIVPMMLGGGVFFSYERFSEPLQPWIRAMPLTALNDGLRAVALEGRGLGSMPVELGVLVGWGVVTFLIGLWVFRWE